MTFDQIKELANSGKLEEAINALKEHLPEGHQILFNSHILLQSQWNRLKIDQQEKILSSQDYSVAFHKIRLTILNFIDELSALN